MECLLEEIKKRRKDIIGGDFNARNGCEEGPLEIGGVKEGTMRRSRDEVINKEGRTLLKKREEKVG